MSGTAEHILHWERGGGGGGANKQAPGPLTCRVFWGNSPPENFEILKQLGNATFSNLGEISKNKRGSTGKTVLKHLFFER